MEKINHTQISNDFIDKHMAELSGAEVKIFIAISRKTIGWHKDTDKISISQLMELTGLSNRQIINSINFLNNKNLITTIKSQGRSTEFEINYDSVKSSPVKKVHRGSEESSQVESKTSEESSHTKEILKDTKQKIIADKDKNTELRKEIITVIGNYYEKLYQQKMIFSNKEIGIIKGIITKSGTRPDRIELIKEKLELYKKEMQNSKQDYFKTFTIGKFLASWDGLVDYEKAQKQEDENFAKEKAIRRAAAFEKSKGVRQSI